MFYKDVLAGLWYEEGSQIKSELPLTYEEFRVKHTS